MATPILTSLWAVFALALLGSAALGGAAWLAPAALLLALAVAHVDARQSIHSLRRNFPLFGRGRWLMEWLRPFLRQYFFESETDGRPIERMFRSVVYQRAKGERDTVPYGTRFDTGAEGYEWLAHSLRARHPHGEELDPRVVFGGGRCAQPYRASVLNISAMSFGALSDNAVRALNGGAALGGFAHNTGEGGLGPAHLAGGGDLIWQIGTGYFGCRDRAGRFDPALFAERAAAPAVKMVEVKLSQGAKPGHGGLLPAAKNSPQIAAIRGVEPGVEVLSPPVHSAFDDAAGMVDFLARLRELSGGKPVGIKLCVGCPGELRAMLRAMALAGEGPDYIAVDGGEGGTGAAPLEFSNSVGMPLRDALALVDDELRGHGLRDRVRVLCSGKVLSGFHLARALALGADACYSARGMMLALGCIQSLLCNTNDCPTGIATQHPSLVGGLVVVDKAQRVALYHRHTVQVLAELVGAAGLRHPGELHRGLIYRRVSQARVRSYAELYPPVADGALLRG